MTNERQRKFVLAVDGGGSKTLCSIATVSSSFTLGDAPFEIIGRGQSGPSNPRSVGFEQAFANIESAIREAIKQSNLDLSTIEVACISLAGAGRSEEKQRSREPLEGQQPILVFVVSLRIDRLRLN